MNLDIEAIKTEDGLSKISHGVDQSGNLIEGFLSDMSTSRQGNHKLERII